LRDNIIKSKTVSTFKYHAINNTYDLSTNKLTTLLNTKNNALDTFDTVTAIRLDFGIKTELQRDPDYMHLLLDGNIQDLFNTLTNRIRRKKDKNGNTYQFLMNWKVEDSKSKGLHIHTVWYFNQSQLPTFTLKSQLYKFMRDLWQDLTHDYGLIKIVTSSTANSTDSFKVDGDDKHYYTILSNDESKVEQLDLYHQQKNRHGTTAGFYRWVSYLAKDGLNITNSNQVADVKKRMGTIKNLPKPKPTEPEPIVLDWDEVPF
tara:strand:- start:1072 stop:1851 length:780 start_codon:yes stop_codon:yes gene_type:complete